MSFDLRQNLLLVRDAALTGKPLFYFYNAMGREMVLTGDVLREILERQKEGTLCVNTYWGFASDPTLEVWSFDDNNDLMLHHRVGRSCTTFLPYEMLESSHEGFKPINGLFIEDSLRRIIKIHLKATCREEQKITWFADLPEPEMRSMLLSLGVGPMRVAREDKEGLVKLHDRWLEDFDDKYKYTHNAIGLDADEKIPADYRPERIRDITERMMANGKTQEMMTQTLNDLLRQCRIRGDIPHPGRNFNQYQLMCYYATHLIFAHDADEKVRSLIDNPQFVINFIYGMYPDHTWITINEETPDYQQSLVRAALISLKSHVQNEIGMYKIDHGMVKFADDFNPQVEEEVVEEEEDDEEEKEEEKEPERPRGYFPASLNAASIGYEYIRPILSKARLYKAKPLAAKTKRGDAKARRDAVALERKNVMDCLSAAVADGWLDSLPDNTLTALAYSLTKMQDNDRYSRESDYLKELIKRAIA